MKGLVKYKDLKELCFLFFKQKDEFEQNNGLLIQGYGRNKKMAMPYIKARLGSYLKKHLNELTYATAKFTKDDVTDFIVSSLENYQGRGILFQWKIEFENPQKDRITEWASIKSRVYIEEGEDKGGHHNPLHTSQGIEECRQKIGRNQ